MSVTETDYGFRDITRALKHLAENELVFGVLAEEGAEKSDDGSPMIKIAASLEYGSERDGKEHIPERPHIRATASEKKDEWQGMQERITGAALRGASNSRLNDLMDAAGARAVGQIQAKIVEVREPPNAPSTIKKKGSDNPLIDKGQHRASFSHERRQR